MRNGNWAAKTGAVFYALWGIVHVLGGGTQLEVLRSKGGGALAALISSGRPFDPKAQAVPDVAAAFMGMGAYNILWIGLLVIVIAVGMNWRNSALGYWLNLAVVGATDLGLLVALLLPGYMAWSDGMIGISLFVLAFVFATAGRGLASRMGGAA
jgi:hypothetical protein